MTEVIKLVPCICECVNPLVAGLIGALIILVILYFCCFVGRAGTYKDR